RGGRSGRRSGVRREDLRLARHGRMAGAGHYHPGHQHHRRDHALLRNRRVAGRPALRRHLRRARSEGPGVMTTAGEEIDAAHGISGSEVEGFASRRTLVLRRFARNRLAVAALTLLALLFVGCYALPSLLPYSYDDLDFNALLQPPNGRHW